MWLGWLVFCDYSFSVPALWCPLATPTILLWFVLSWTWGISSQLLQQSAAAGPYLGWGVSPHHCPAQPWTWNSPSRPSGIRAATTPWMWSCSSRLFATSWNVAYQVPPAMGFSRQECLNGLPFTSPGDLSNPGIEPGSPALQADALPSEPPQKLYVLKVTSNICEAPAE